MISAYLVLFVFERAQCFVMRYHNDSDGRFLSGGRCRRNEETMLWRM